MDICACILCLGIFISKISGGIIMKKFVSIVLATIFILACMPFSSSAVGEIEYIPDGTIITGTKVVGPGETVILLAGSSVGPDAQVIVVPGGSLIVAGLVVNNGTIIGNVVVAPGATLLHTVWVTDAYDADLGNYSVWYNDSPTVGSNWLDLASYKNVRAGAGYGYITVGTTTIHAVPVQVEHGKPLYIACQIDNPVDAERYDPNNFKVTYSNATFSGQKPLETLGGFFYLPSVENGGVVFVNGYTEENMIKRFTINLPFAESKYAVVAIYNGIPHYHYNTFKVRYGDTFDFHVEVNYDDYNVDYMVVTVNGIPIEPVDPENRIYSLSPDNFKNPNTGLAVFPDGITGPVEIRVAGVNAMNLTNIIQTIQDIMAMVLTIIKSFIIDLWPGNPWWPVTP